MKLDALWAFRTTYKTPIWISPYHLVFGKVCHLLVEPKHHAYLTVKKLNLDWELARKKMIDQLFQLHAYANATLYREKTKRWYDKHYCLKF